MKYKCNMIKDLIPLCQDQVASKESEQAVIEHISECSSCENYYKKVLEEMNIHEDSSAHDDSIKEKSSYVILAKRIRKRRIIVQLVSIPVFLVVWFFSINYASGYRYSALAAAKTSKRLNYSSQLLGECEWNNLKYYFYESATGYDVVEVQKDWNGWHNNELFLSWDKWNDGERGLVMVGELYSWGENIGVQLFPFLVRDESVKTVEARFFGETKSLEVNRDSLNVMMFENTDSNLVNEPYAVAMDASGDVIYELIDEDGKWVWEPKQ